MAEEKADQAEQAEQEEPQIETDDFVSDEEVQERIDEGDEYVDEEPVFTPQDVEEEAGEEAEAEEETEKVDSVQHDGGEGGGATQAVPPQATQPPFSENQFEWGRYLNLSRDEVQNFAGGPAAFDRMVSQVSNAVDIGYSSTEPEGFTLEEIEEDEVLSKMNDHYSGEIEQLKGQIAHISGVNNAMMEKEQKRMAQASADQFDGICNNMDEGLFGRGTINELGPDAGDNRKALANVVSRLGHGYAARGENVPPMQQLVKEAYGAAFGGTIENQTLRKASEKSKKMSSQTTAKPTHTDSAPANAEQAALQAAYQWQKEKGWI